MVNKYMAAGVAAAALMGVGGPAHAGKDLDAVKARGQLICGVNTGVAGFALPTARASGPASTSTCAAPSPRPCSATPKGQVRAD